MNQDKINKLLTQSNTDLNNTVRTLKSLQNNELTPIKSGLDHLDKVGLGGLFPDTIVVVSARSAHGKSWTSNLIRNSILKDPNEDIGVLLWNLEMPFFALLLLELKKVLHKPLKQIVSEPPLDSERDKYNRVIEEFKDPRLIKIDETVDPDEWYAVTREYIIRNLDKKQLFVIIDHIGIIKGSNKTESIQNTMEYANMLKLEFKGKLTFIVLGQLNREIENRWRNKDSNPFTLFPDSSSLFGSDTLMFYGDILMVQVIPQVAGMDKYGIVNIERNPHLEYFVHPDDQGSAKDYVRLRGYNTVYYHYVKVRLMDGEPTIYAQVLDSDYEEYLNEVREYEKDMTAEAEEIDF